ncbi:C40 family peptidase [Luteipulveratus halotolerans]|uniref:NlpC/P60 domain-containing protein n=1 Tax=Luteipulveratus halotolerans TaxID=1631356 RepID=A0A0L6CI96_9MICO|nr:NlpC/P60 family protein [Luteipulveratus halotolerans]KNX37238.1 hypothetical protein VV01_08910 [Luteipulveratus halotolerans]
MHEPTASPQLATVVPPVTVLWRDPTSPRAVDGVITADVPDHAQWLHDMDVATDRAQGRWGLDDRIDSQVVQGEPVIIVERHDDWTRVVCPWQPNKGDARGYPGWVRTAHLQTCDERTASFDRVGAAGPVTRSEVVETARQYLGLPYLWGGVSATALDCSGLVHIACRAHGIMVPRDGDDQAAACDPVQQGEEQLGDLYFFAHPGKTIHHVGFVTGPRLMLHAPGTGTGIVDEPMRPDRVETLVAIGRIPTLS